MLDGHRRRETVDVIQLGLLHLTDDAPAAALYVAFVLEHDHGWTLYPDEPLEMELCHGLSTSPADPR